MQKVKKEKTKKSWQPPASKVDVLFGDHSQFSKADQAQEIMYDAWDETTSKQRIKLAQKALKVSADCADAYVLLANEMAKDANEAMELYKKGVEAGERTLGKKAFAECVGHFWGMLETRPYMRARHRLAESLWESGRREEAIEHYREMLRLNPNDNQGIRYLLIPCLLQLKFYDELNELLNKYKGEPTATWAYTRCLLGFVQTGNTEGNNKLLKKAIKTNAHVPLYLMGGKQLPKKLPDYIGFGDDSEAQEYIYANLFIWKNTDGAIGWLVKQV